MLLMLALIVGSFAGCGQAEQTAPAAQADAAAETAPSEETAAGARTEETTQAEENDRAEEAAQAASSASETTDNAEVVEIKTGVLSYLNQSEEDYASGETPKSAAIAYLVSNGYVNNAAEKPEGNDGKPLIKITYYDTLDSMVMALQSGDEKMIQLPESTADYLCANNDDLVKNLSLSEKSADGFGKALINRLSSAYSFMMTEDHADLCEEFNSAIKDMAQDKTLDNLTQKYIYDVINGGEIETIEFEKNDGDTIRVAVTGCLPPLDYVAADGTFAGFNTVFLAELGKRLHKNIELVQVDSIGRAAALASGAVDVVFWARSYTGPIAGMSQEEFEQFRKKQRAGFTDEEIALMDSLHGNKQFSENARRDIPEGMICTIPYFTDFTTVVTLKE